MRAEHERVSTERDRLAEEMLGMVEPIVRIAHLVGEIEFCDRQIGRLNATSAVRLGYVPMVLAGTAPAIKALFQDALVWDAFIAVAGLQPPPAAGVRTAWIRMTASGLRRPVERPLRCGVRAGAAV
jgi:hypothetical protein